MLPKNRILSPPGKILLEEFMKPLGAHDSRTVRHPRHRYRVTQMTHDSEPVCHLSWLRGDRDAAPDLGAVVPHIDSNGAQHWRQPVQFVRQGLGVADLAYAAKQVEQFARGSLPFVPLRHQRPDRAG